MTLTNMSFSQSISEPMYSISGDYYSGHPSGIFEVDIQGIITDQRVLRLFMELGTNPLTALRVLEQEFMCIFCGSPNPITNRHCSQCGAPRGFLIGEGH